jgi:hypothetical protein
MSQEGYIFILRVIALGNNDGIASTPFGYSRCP